MYTRYWPVEIYDLRLGVSPGRIAVKTTRCRFDLTTPDEDTCGPCETPCAAALDRFWPLVYDEPPIYSAAPKGGAGFPAGVLAILP
jgi:hypothetical protein